jgi:hypothetical protein
MSDSDAVVSPGAKGMRFCHDMNCSCSEDRLSRAIDILGEL